VAGPRTRDARGCVRSHGSNYNVTVLIYVWNGKRLARKQKIASGLSGERFGAANYVLVSSFLRNNYFQIV
jgi:hypothetical protein